MISMPISALEKHSFKPLQSRLLSLGKAMQWRGFIAFIGGMAAALPRMAQAQQADR
jgi:hypothetical protein